MTMQAVATRLMRCAASGVSPVTGLVVSVLIRLLLGPRVIHLPVDTGTGTITSADGCNRQLKPQEEVVRMARVIIPVPQSEPVVVADLVRGDWISDGHQGPWHHVLAVTDAVLTLGDSEDQATDVPVAPGAMALRLHPKDAPRIWRTAPAGE